MTMERKKRKYERIIATKSHKHFEVKIYDTFFNSFSHVNLFLMDVRFLIFATRYLLLVVCFLPVDFYDIFSLLSMATGTKYSRASVSCFVVQQSLSFLTNSLFDLLCLALCLTHFYICFFSLH